MSDNPYQPPVGAFSDQPLPQTPPSPKHSGFGIVSFLLSLIAGALVFVMIAVATYLAATTPEEFGEESPQAIMVGLGIMGGMGLAVIGLGLGVAGIVQPHRKKVFAILGLIFNFLLFFSVCGLVGLGLAVSG